MLGGDPGITQSLGRMYKEEGPGNASRGTFDADLLKYVTRAQQTPSSDSPYRPIISTPLASRASKANVRQSSAKS